MMEETLFPRGTGSTTESSSSSKKRSTSIDETISANASAFKKSKKEENLFGNDLVKKRRSTALVPKGGSADKGITTLPQGIQPGGGAVLPTSSHPKRDALIESLTFGKLDKGMKLLGCIREDGVTEEYCIVSLPNMLTGFIRRGVGGGDANTPLTEVLSSLQMLPVVVKSTSVDTQSKRKIELSILPQDLNAGISPDQLYLPGLTIRGQIISVEDHGCIVNVGMGSAVTAFLKFENAEGYDVSSDLNVGRCFDFRVERPKTATPTSSKKDKKRRRGADSTAATNILIQLTLPSKNEKFEIIKQLTQPTGTSALSPSAKGIKVAHTIKSLVPGMLVECKVEEYARNGLLVTFLNSVFRGAIDENHLNFLHFDASSKKEGSGWKDIWKEEAYVSEVTARIIAVDPITKILRLSLLPHILSLQAPSKPSFQVGDIVKGSHVVRIDGSVGALLTVETEGDDEKSKKDGTTISHPLARLGTKYQGAISRTGIYVNASKASNNAEISETDLQKLFKKQHSKDTPVRILTSSHCLIENFCTASTAPDIISAHVLSHADLKPGETYRQAKILAYQDYGVIVSLGQNVRALCQTIHLSDTATAGGATSEYQKKAHRIKFAPGKTIDVKCISVDVANKQAYVTHKKSLLSDKLTPLTSHTQIAKNQLYVGCITKVDAVKGIVVAFYNNIYGYCTAKRLAKEMGVENVAESYRVGNVIKCRVVQLGKHNNKLELSLDTTTEAIERDEKELQEVQSNSILTVGMFIPSNSVKVIQMVDSSEDVRKNKIINGYAMVVVKLKNLVTGDKKMKGEIECRLPYEQLEDSYQQNDTDDLSATLDEVAKNTLRVGKKLENDAVVLVNADATRDDIPILSLRPSFIESFQQNKDNDEKKNNFVPSTASELYIGAKITGYVVRHDQRFGGFVRFANNLTGLIPKLKKGLEEKMYSTVKCRIAALDTTVSPPRIILKKSKKDKSLAVMDALEIKKGEVLGDVVVDDVNFYRASVILLDKKYEHEKRGRSLRARIHVTMTNGNEVKLDKKKKKSKGEEFHADEKKITKHHPFYKWIKGLIIRDTICVSTEEKNGVLRVELTSRASSDLPPIIEKVEDLELNQEITCVVTDILKNNFGIKVQICPGVSSVIPGLELSDDDEVLNNLSSHYEIGQSIKCTVVQKVQPLYRRRNKQKQKTQYQLSALSSSSEKPKINDIIVARINHGIPSSNAPALMMDYRNGIVARCCITELTETEDWINMPLGRATKEETDSEKPKEGAIVTDEEKDHEDDEEDNNEENEESTEDQNYGNAFYPTGKYVKCKVLGTKGSVLEVSMQERRIEGDVDDDAPPKLKDIVQAYVVTTNKKGCYVRLSRNITGRIILKELSDSFIPDPISTFPQGRLVQCKVKQVKIGKGGTTIDLDMRESSILESQDKLTFEEIKEGEKYKGIITRIERYGVFVRLENSQVSGLAHISECSDKFVKGGLGEHYDPGDLVKAYVLKVDNEQKKVNFSLKASHFEGDIDSDDESSSDSEMEDVADSDGSESEKDDAFTSGSEDNSLDSDDDNFATKLASKMQSSDDASSEDEDEESGESSDEDSSEDGSSSDEEEEGANAQGMDTDIGFDWGGNVTTKTKSQDDDDSSSDSDTSDDDDDDKASSGKKKSKKKAAEKRREEKEIALRESALADGTLDENPETRADFERLIASNPNFSEHWIKFMAYYLSLADIESARSVANRAFDRIEFRQEGEKLNVWTALLTLELKYGSPKTLQETIDRACQHNNPKQVYLRVCEMLERVVTDSFTGVSKPSSEKTKMQSEAVKNADEMFSKMCKKFKSKKTVWIAHLKYLLKSGRFQEAHDLLKRSLKSLPSHKHIETMVKFAQMEFEFGSVERGRTIFDGILLKYPKRMDLLYVYVDKEVKAGEMEAARSIFKRVIDPSRQSKFKFSDKQMKSLFKKWYRIEEANGNDDSREEVKAAAKSYVENSAKA